MMKQYKGFKIRTIQNLEYMYQYIVTKQGFRDSSIISFCDETLALEECMREIDGGLFDDLFQNFIDENNSETRNSLEIV